MRLELLVLRAHQIFDEREFASRNIRWAEIDLTEIADDEQRARELDRVIELDALTRFDLTNPPLLRFTLIRTAPEHFRLVMTNHHLVLDGWSTPLLVRELLTLYVTAGDASMLPPARPGSVGWRKSP